MPYGQVSPRFGNLGFDAAVTTEEDEGPGALSILGAAFRIGNDIGAPLYSGRRGYREYLEQNEGNDRVKWDYSYDPGIDRDVRDMFERFPTEFRQARNKGHALFIAQGLRDELRDFQTLGEAGGIKSFFALGVAGIASPLSLIPGVAVGKGAKAAGTASKALRALSLGEDVLENAARLGVVLTAAERAALRNQNVARVALVGGLDVDLDAVRSIARASVIREQVGRGRNLIPILNRAPKDFAKAVAAGAAVGLFSETMIGSSLRTQEESYALETALVSGAFTGLLSLPGLRSATSTRRSLTKLIEGGEREIAEAGKKTVFSYEFGAPVKRAEGDALRGGVVDLETPRAQANALDELAESSRRELLTNEEQALVDEVLEIRGRENPSTADLLEFYLERVQEAQKLGQKIPAQRGRDPLLPGQKTAADFDAEDLANLEAELQRIATPGKDEAKIRAELAALRQSGPTQADLSEWYDGLRYQYERGRVRLTDAGNTPSMAPRPLDAPQGGGRTVGDPDAGFAPSTLPEPRQGLSGRGVPALDVPLPIPKLWENPSRQEIAELFDIMSEQATFSGKDPLLVPRESRLLNEIERMRAVREGQQPDVTPVFRDRPAPTRAQLLRFWRERSAEGTIRAGDRRVMLPREARALHRLELVRAERQSAPTPAFTPVVRMPDGSYRQLSVAERYARSYQRGYAKVKAANALRTMLAEGGAEIVDGDPRFRFLRTPEIPDEDLARLIDDAVAAGRFEELPPEVKAAAYQRMVGGISTELPGEGTLIGRLFYSTFRYSPQNRLHLNQNQYVREIGRRLVNSGLLPKGFVQSSVQARIKSHAGGGAVLARRLHALYKAGKRDHRLNKAGWGRQVVLKALGKAEGGKGIDEAAAELRKFLDAWTERALEVGLITPDQIGRGVDDFYIPRLYDWDYIRQNRGEFTQLVRRYYGDAADEIVEDMLSTQTKSFNEYLIQRLEPGATKSRELTRIPTDELLDFMYHDPEYLVEAYTRDMGAALEYAALTPGDPLDGLTLRSARERVNQIYDELMEKDPGSFDRLKNERDRALLDIEFIRKYHLGIQAIDPSASAAGLVAPLRAVAAVTFLSKAGLSSLADAAAVAWHAPIRSLVKGAVAAIRDVIREKLGGRITGDMSAQVRALELAHSDLAKAGALIDLTGQYQGLRRRRGRRGVRAGAIRAAGGVADFMMTWTGMKSINAYAKQIASYTTADMILDAAERVARGDVLGEKILRDMNRIGVDDAMLRRIAEEISVPSRVVNDMGLRVPVLDQWDRGLADEFRATVFQSIDQSIPSPGRAEVPRVFSSEVGSLIFQFMSFLMDSNTKLLGRGVGQQLVMNREARAASAILTMGAMGTLVSVLRSAADGRLEDMTLSDHVMDGVHYSGIGGLLMETHNYLSRQTEGEYDLANLVDAKTVYEKYGRNSVRPDIPAIDMFDSLAAEARRNYKLITGEPLRQRDIDLMWSRAPVLNLPHLRAPLRYMLEQSR